MNYYPLTHKIDLSLCFRQAWRGFRLWWIPLCVVATVILFSQSWLPRWLIADSARELRPFVVAWNECRTAVACNEKSLSGASQELVDSWIVLAARPQTFEAVIALVLRLVSVVAVLYLPICLLQMLMIVFSKAAVHAPLQQSGRATTMLNDMTYGVRAIGSDRVVRRDMKRSLLTSISYAFLTALKLFAFFYGILPLLLIFIWEPPLLGILLLLAGTAVLSMLSLLTGLYLYIRLFFTGFLITEESANPFKAIAASWHMSSGNFCGILVIFFAAFVIMSVAALTVIGVIPANSFNYTLRAAAYRQLKPVAPSEAGL